MRGSYLLAAALVASSGWSGRGLAQSAGQWHDSAEIYARICGYCHDTGVGPALKGSHFPADQIREVVRHGNKAMPAFKPSEFSDAELAKLADMLSAAPADAPAKP